MNDALALIDKTLDNIDAIPAVWAATEVAELLEDIRRALAADVENTKEQ